jgi:TolA-binding protein
MYSLSSPCFLRHLIAVVALCGAFLGNAQRPAHFDHTNADLVHAQELYAKSKFAAAQYEFEQVTARIVDAHDPTRTEAEYMSALCAVRLFHNDASHRLLAFIDAHPENPHVRSCSFELFRHYFERKRYDDAMAWASRVLENELDEAERDEFIFKKGYAHFQQGQQDKSLLELNKVKDGTSLYAAPATYYAAHINYEKGNYATALQGFEKLSTDPNFGKVVPYYIAQVKFLQGDYDALQAYVKPLLEDPLGAKRVDQINRLAGEAYYRTGKYSEALPYLQKSTQRTGVDRGDRYILGYTYYRTAEWKAALDQFNLVASADDSLAQLASYHMGDCYLKLSEKTYARNAFKRAYDLGNVSGADDKVTEDALFNYAKLSYEVSFDPYNEAIIALRDYLKAYPNSPRHDEAQEFLLNVFLKTRNYEDALASLDAIKNKDIRLQEAYQKLAFDRGVELYEGRKFAEAATFFERALKFPVNKQANAMAHYWSGESQYALGEYDKALAKYDALRNTSGAYATDLYEQASYSMGYCYFKQKQYGEASTAFRRFAGAPRIDPRQKSDALLRVGDCAFMGEDYPTAIKWYDDAMRAGSPDKDYAQYQKALCLGLQQKWTEKITVLKALLADKPGSQYAADAKFQLGETYLNLENDTEALRYYKQVLDGHPNCPHIRQSMLQGALIHKRGGQPDKALEEFKAIVAKYPTADGSRDALAGVKSIYVEQGRVAEYETYLKTLSFVDPASQDLDNDYYQSAEKLYMDGKCDQAVGAFKDYLSKYPKGGYAINAHFYQADCHYQAKRYAEALPGFEAVIGAKAAQFLESSLFAASDILFRDKRWEGALDRFAELEQVASVPQNTLVAQVGQMRCLKELGRVEEAGKVAEKVIPTADKVLPDGNQRADLKAEAGLAVARGLLYRNELDAAYTKFKAVSTGNKGALGAEAKYHMAYVRHLQKKYRDAEKEVFALAKEFGPYKHWISKAFILLGDVYLQLDDRFQAKTALQSVIDHSDEPELVAEARQRLDAINASEIQQTTPTPQEVIEIPLDGGSKPNDGKDQ